MSSTTPAFALRLATNGWLGLWILGGCGGEAPSPGGAGAYSVRSAATFTADGATRTQEIVASCGPGASSGDAPDQHWVNRADGAVLVVHDLVPCRWEKGAPPDGETPLLSEEMVDPEAVAQRVAHTVSWAYDAPAAPTRATGWYTPHLFSAAGAGGAHLAVKLSPGLGTPTHTRAEALPSLAAELAAARWEGLSAVVYTYIGQAPCPTTGVTALSATDACFVAPRCGEGVQRECWSVAGALVPTIDAEARRYDFAGEPDPALVGTALRVLPTTALATPTTPEAVAPASLSGCYAGQCVGSGAWFDASRGWLVDVSQIKELPG